MIWKGRRKTYGTKKEDRQRVVEEVWETCKEIKLYKDSQSEVI
jgi:hypothetical protein